jgi:hypothetical protein
MTCSRKPTEVAAECSRGSSGECQDRGMVANNGSGLPEGAKVHRERGNDDYQNDQTRDGD